MENNNYCFAGLVENINKGEGFSNITVVLDDKATRQNIKIDKDHVDDFILGKVYHFNTICKIIKDKLVLVLIDATIIYDCIKDQNELEAVLAKFYDYAPICVEEVKKHIETTIRGLKNDRIRSIVSQIYEDNKADFYTFPAATKYHHAYIGGLAYHTETMLKLAEGFLRVYDYLNSDLVYGGIILHDITKNKELTSPDLAQYSTEGQLLGHLVMGTLAVENAAVKLGLKNTEEALLLEHIVLSSHGLPQFGSAKKPMIGEALLVWYVDTIDSKFTVLGEELLKTIPGKFTEPINVLDKVKFYKKTID